MSMSDYFKFEPVGAQLVKIDSESYHNDKSAINASGMKVILSSPLKFWHENMNPKRERKKPTPAMEFGTLCHACLFEPPTVKDVCNTLDSKVVKKVDEAWDIARAVLANEFCEAIAIGLGAPEQTIYWTEIVELDDGEVINVQCKARLDWMCEPKPDIGIEIGFIYDLKTTLDASDEEFERSAYNLQYHISAAWYCRAYYALFSVIPPFFFIAAEKEDPYDNQVFEESIENLESGWKDCAKALKTYAQCMRDGKWPGYTKTIKTLKRPRWAKENYNG